MSMMSLILAAALHTVAPVPGKCTEPAAENVGKPGCFLSAQLQIVSAPETLYWHIHEFETLDAASTEAARHATAIALRVHDRAWLYVLGDADISVTGGTRRDVVGPFRMPPGTPVTARFLESVFPPGMQTRVHAHPGPEAFYVVDGEQCTESVTDRHIITPGTSYIVASGPHLQAAPKGRRSLVLLLLPAGAPWMTLDETWTPTGFCDAASDAEVRAP